MRHKFLVGFLVLALAAFGIVPAAAQDEFVFGVVLVGPDNDAGWSQAHYEGGRYVEAQIPGTRMLWFESLNPVDNPQTDLMGVVTEFVDQGARLIFTTSDDFQAETDAVATAFPDITFIHISGDQVLTGDAPPNVGNLMGQMEWGKLIGGCAAALATETGSIGYLGPLVNDETRRLAASAYLGARYCYEHYKGGDADDLVFDVVWIGFWVPTPDTLDPTEVTDSFFDGGADVVISGIDTPQAIQTAGVRAQEGERVFAVPYDHVGACDLAPDVCLGVPYFNWGPSYVEIVQSAIDGTWQPSWDWVGPDWSDLNNLATTHVGFENGPALTEVQSAQLDEFIADLAEYATNPFVPASFALWSGPLTLKESGEELAAAGEIVSALDVWYLPELLAGMIGDSFTQGN